MPQNDVNKTYKSQVFRHENVEQKDLNTIEFMGDDPSSTSLAENPMRIWVNTTTNAVKYTTDGSTITELTSDAPPPVSSAVDANSLINGNFDVWQRNVTFTNPATATYTADRFQNVINSVGTLPATITHARVSIPPGELPGSSFAYQISTSGAGSGFTGTDNNTIQTKIENGARYMCGLGKKVTISFWARTDIPGKRLGVNGSQIYGTGGTPSTGEVVSGQIITLSSTWTKYVVTVTTNTITGKTFGTNNDDYFATNFTIMFGSTIAVNRFGVSTTEGYGGAGNIFIAQVKVETGDTATTFLPRSFAEELQLCMRYFEKSYSYDAIPGGSSPAGEEMFKPYGTSANGMNAGVYKVPKRLSNPTVIIYASRTGTQGRVRDIDGSVDVVASTFGIGDKKVGWVDAGTVTSGNRLIWHWTSDAEL